MSWPAATLGLGLGLGFMAMLCVLVWLMMR